MDNQNLNKIDSLQLLLGKPQVIENKCIVYPLTLREIAEITEEKFFKYLNLLTLTQEDIKQNFEDVKEELTPFRFLLINSLNEEFSVEIEKAFSTFIREEVNILPKAQLIQIGKTEERRFLEEKDFEFLQQILRAQNSLEEQDDLSNPANEHAARIIEKLKQRKDLLNKKGGDDKVTFSDLVSCLAAKGNGINIFNVWDLTYYSFNNMFKRLKMIEDYDMNVRSLLAGADPKKIEMKHWIRNINNE